MHILSGRSSTYLLQIAARSNQESIRRIVLVPPALIGECVGTKIFLTQAGCFVRSKANSSLNITPEHTVKRLEYRVNPIHQ